MKWLLMKFTVRLHQNNIPSFRSSKLRPKPGSSLRILFNVRLRSPLKLLSTTLKCSLHSRHPFHPSRSLTTTPSLTHNLSLLSRLFLPPAAIQRCNQVLESIYTRRTGLLLLLFRGTLWALRLVIMGLRLMLPCRGRRPRGCFPCFFSIISLFQISGKVFLAQIRIWIWIWPVGMGGGFVFRSLMRP